MKPLPPKGTRDYFPAQLRTREHVVSTARRVFESFGYAPLETPAVERLDVLTGKYGDEADQLIFRILKRGEAGERGEADLGLRYDLTVPLPRTRTSPSRSSVIRSSRCGGRSGRKKAASANSSSATSTASAPPPCSPTPK
jgi:histidyl-tRNA synthetase